MDRMNRVGTVARAALLIILALVVVGCSCDTEQSEGFALYLPAVETPVSQLPILSHIKLADAPLVSGADIVSYSKDTHQIQLTAAAFRRVADLEVPVRGLAFVVSVDRQPIYTGAFYTSLSSMSFDGVVIVTPLDSDVTAACRHMIQLELGYPGPSFFSGEDPRADPAILGSLEQVGKLH